MKKFLITCFYLALTLAVCAVSFLLPSTLNTYQDRQIFAKIEHTAMDPPELTYSTSLYDTLRLICSPHYFVDYPSTGSRRTSEEIHAAAADLVEKLSEYNILSADAKNHIANYSSNLQLAIESENRNNIEEIDSVSNGQSNTAIAETDAKTDDESASENPSAQNEKENSSDIATAVVWLCSITFDSGHWISLRIDDKTCKAVSLSICTERVQMMVSSGYEPELDAFVSSVAAFLENYFELPANPQKLNIVHSYISLYDKSKSFEASYLIQLKEENGTVIQLPLHIYPETVTIGTYAFHSTS